MEGLIFKSHMSALEQLGKMLWWSKPIRIEDGLSGLLSLTLHWMETLLRSTLLIYRGPHLASWAGLSRTFASKVYIITWNGTQIKVFCLPRICSDVSRQIRYLEGARAPPEKLEIWEDETKLWTNEENMWFSTLSQVEPIIYKIMNDMRNWILV
jgi:hypothetical protein